MEVKIENTLRTRSIVKNALIDTASDLTRLPPRIKDVLQLTEFSKAMIQFGDGRVVEPPTYIATISWNGFRFPVEVYYATKDIDYVLIGRNLLRELVMHCDGKQELLTFDCTDHPPSVTTPENPP